MQTLASSFPVETTADGMEDDNLSSLVCGISIARIIPIYVTLISAIKGSEHILSGDRMVITKNFWVPFGLIYTIGQIRHLSKGPNKHG